MVPEARMLSRMLTLEEEEDKKADGEGGRNQQVLLCQVCDWDTQKIRRRREER